MSALISRRQTDQHENIADFSRLIGMEMHVVQLHHSTRVIANDVPFVKSSNRTRLNATANARDFLVWLQFYSDLWKLVDLWILSLHRNR